MATVNWNTKGIVADLLEEELDDNIEVVIKSEGDSGGPKITNLSGTEVQIEENENRSMERADITYSSFDKQSVVYLTIRSPSRVEETWEEVMRVLLENRTHLEGLEGGWDYITVDDLSVEDPTFNKHTSTIRVNFVAESQVFDGNIGK